MSTKFSIRLLCASAVGDGGARSVGEKSVTYLTLLTQGCLRNVLNKIHRDDPSSVLGFDSIRISIYGPVELVQIFKLPYVFLFTYLVSVAWH